MLAAVLPLLFVVISGYTSSGVFNLGPVATAGVPTRVNFNYSASSCSSPLSDQGCGWPYLRLLLKADPRYTPGDITIWEPYCFISSCIATNLTNFEITIPTSAVPDGFPYTFDYSLFRPASNGSYSFYSAIWSAFDSPSFNITGSNATWTDYDKSGRWWSDNANQPWFSNLTCEALECARQCAEDIEAPLVPFVGLAIPKLDACVEACPGMGWDPTKCITKNAVAATSTTMTTLTPAPSMGSSGSTFAVASASSAARSPAIRISQGRLPSALTAAVILCTIRGAF